MHPHNFIVTLILGALAISSATHGAAIDHAIVQDLLPVNKRDMSSIGAGIMQAEVAQAMVLKRHNHDPADQHNKHAPKSSCNCEDDNDGDHNDGDDDGHGNANGQTGGSHGTLTMTMVPDATGTGMHPTMTTKPSGAMAVRIRSRTRASVVAGMASVILAIYFL
ncbi:hypothetical protein BG011_009296 [Mortierella polycephala]|uniref:Uncharacterized protein n=1 Tax=Mortierella polycephala TaxID=41804 RepID=A0A9P6U7Z4_9FUNG|nr:hypothetical protein BG011_009296 [Mortierella polycephala]